MEGSGGDKVRLDKWLWAARFFKTRALAARFVEEGRVRLIHNRLETRLDKPSRSVHLGDAITFAVGGRLVAVVVRGLGERRGPPNEARALYEDSPASPPLP